MKPLHKYVVASICIVIVILRAVFPKMTFDVISLSLVGIGVIALLLPESISILDRTRKVKIGDIELELDELKKNVELVEENIAEKTSSDVNKNGDESIPASQPQELIPLDGEYYHYLFGKDADLNHDALQMNIIKLSLHLESILKRIYEKMIDTKAPLGIASLGRKLKQADVIDGYTLELLMQFNMIRNQIVHESEPRSSAELISFIDLGIRVEKIISRLESDIISGRFK